MNWYLFAGYAVFWILIFVYIVMIHRIQGRMRDDLRRIADQIEN